MKIGFNISPLLNEHKNRGTGSYTQSLLKALKEKQDNSFKLIEFTNKIFEEVDLVHYPFFDPFFLTLPLIKEKPTVVTVHDLIPIVFPEHFPRGFKGEIKWQIQKWSLKGASAVITDSNNSFKDIKRLVGIRQDKIFTIPLAADPIFRPIADKKGLNKIREKYGLPDKFVLYVGDVNWNKNVTGLIKAFTKISQQLKLVLVGGSFLNNDLPEAKEINQLINQLRQEKEVLKLGFVPQEDLVGIYNRASVYVQPSFYEGFGLPILEAMGCGCPVVVSSSSSLPEVAGEATLYVDAYDVSDITEKLESILRNKLLRNQLIVKGLKQAKKFSWERVARETIRVYKRVLHV